ncbi:MAG: HAMP domain-containing sensor histidine kinase [Bacteroidota bacterium]
MKSNHPNPISSSLAAKSTHSAEVSQESQDYQMIVPLDKIVEVRWKPESAFASLIPETGYELALHQVPIHAVFQSLGKEESRLRKLVSLLTSGEVQRVDSTISVDLPSSKTRTIELSCTLEHDLSGDLWIVLSLGRKTEHSEIEQILPVGCLSADAHTGAILHANARVLSLLNVPDSDFSNISWQRVPEWLDFVREVTEQGTVWNRILEVAPDKTWALFSAQYIKGKIVAVAQDVSEVQKEVQKLEKLNMELDNFVYHASHDLRAPLRSMQGLITLLRSETNAHERDKFVSLIEGSLKRLDAFLVDLLSISRSRRGQPQQLQKINFMVEVEKAVSSFFHLQDQRNLEISTRISQPFTFQSDLTKVRVILNNLLSNAVKYRRYEVKKSRIKVEVRVTKKQTNIKISDNGLGIESEHLPHIFEMFYRGTDRSEGSGLGLYIVRETIEKLNGTISVTSRPKSGTTFRVVLPNKHTSALKK